MDFSDLIVTILCALGLFSVIVFVVCLLGYILGKMDQLRDD